MKLFKTLFDIIIIFLFIPFLVPFFLLIILFIFIFDGFPIFYIEERVGKNLLPFKIIKFRTMKESKENIIISKDSLFLLTRTGKFLRKWGMDELPQLINVLKGEMSLVGPRPIPTTHFINNSKNRFRFRVKPGITGLAQINGRNKISWDEKLIFDKLYVENLSIIQDFKILLKTPFSLMNDDHLMRS